MKKPSPYAIKRAKRTLFGRVLCRLVGEQTGAVMMEYVVIGVLVVAAAVAMVQLFGGGIRKQFEAMYRALFGDKTGTTTVITETRGSMDGDTKQAQDFGKTVSGEDSGGDGGETAGD